jgi:hypothetical protein
MNTKREIKAGSIGGETREPAGRHRHNNFHAIQGGYYINEEYRARQA